MTQQQVSPDEAEISATVLLSNRLAKRDVVVRVEVKDGQRVISRHEQQMTLEKEKDEKVVFPIKIESQYIMYIYGMGNEILLCIKRKQLYGQMDGYWIR